MPLIIPIPNVRPEHNLTQDSPSSVASSMAPTMPDSSWKGSSREDSISSGGFFSDLESLKADDIPVIVSRAATDEWSARGGLGISDEIMMSHRPFMQGHPPMIHSDSAPPAIESGLSLSTLDDKTPMRKRSSEAIQIKRDQLEKSRINAGGPEEGDDEDEELGLVQIRQKSPPIGKTARQSSKLGIEMMRTNSRGSVISMHDDRTAEPDSLRKSLEILEERMESMQIIEEIDSVVVQPRKMQRTASSHSHPEAEQLRPASRGHITPPEIFPHKPGHLVADFVEQTDRTPMPKKTVDLQEEQTPKPQGSPSGPSK